MLSRGKERLVSSSLSDIYALSEVAEKGFMESIIYCFWNSEQASTISPKCRVAVRLVSSCANLIAVLSFFRHVEKDGTRALGVFDRDSETSRIHHLWRQTDENLRLVPKSVPISLQRFGLLGGKPVQRKFEGETDEKIKPVLAFDQKFDKPNVHCLRELVRTAMP